MKKIVRISIEEQTLLKRLNNDQLRFLINLSDSKDYPRLIEIINLLIDIEKNQFFGEDESKYSEPVWQARHAYSRGGVGKLVFFMHLVHGAKDEYHRREKERKKK